MGFAVRPAALRGCAELIDEQVGQVDAARSYERTEIDAEIGWGGVLAVLGEVYPTLVTDLNNTTNRVGVLFDQTKDALNEAAHTYETKDHDGAVALDSTMPGREQGDVLPPDQREPAAPFSPRRVPSGRLNPPGEYSGQFRWQMDVLDAVSLSISALVRQGLVGLTGHDPFEPVMRDWVGDWAAIRSAADAWHNVRFAFEDLGTNIVHGAQDLAQDWQGNAAGTCLTHLEELARSLHGQAERCRFVRDKLVEAADGAAEMYKAASGLMSSAIDWAVTAVIAAGAGTATVEFLGVGVAGWVLAGVAVERVVARLAEVASIISNFKNLFEGIVGMLKNVHGTSFDGYQITPLPAEPYSPPR